MNKALKWFGFIAWAGILMNLTFALPALFAPDLLNGSVGVGLVQFSHVWLGNVGMLLITLCVFYIPAAADPERYSTYAWIMVFARLFAALFWWMEMGQPGEPHRVLIPFLIGDLVMGVLLGTTLQIGISDAKKMRLENVALWFRNRFASAKAFFTSGLVRLALLILIVSLGSVGYGLWYYLVRELPDTSYSDPAEHFKYGVIGLGNDSRIPWYVWEVLPPCSRTNFREDREDGPPSVCCRNRDTQRPWVSPTVKSGTPALNRTVRSAIPPPINVRRTAYPL